MAHREREAKLVVPRSFRVPPPEALAKGIGSAAATGCVEQHAVYHDTADLRLTRSGVSLRHRSDDGWTVKLPVHTGASTLVRTEHSFGGEPGTPPAAARGLVRAWTRTEPLGAVAWIDTTRRTTALLGARGRPLAELADDDVVGRATRGPEVRFREIEVELADGAPDSLLRDVRRAFRRAGARPIHARSKVARVLGDAAERPPDVPGEVELGRHATAADLVRVAVARSLHQLIAFDPALRLTDDVEAVHQARVATRRLRSDLRTFRPLVDPAWSEPLRDELRWLGGLLGHVRDADVLLADLDAKAEHLPESRRPRVAVLTARLQDARRRDLVLLRDALDSERYARLLDDLVDATHAPRLRPGTGKRRAATVARRLVARPRRRLRRKAAKLGPDASDTALHEVRKRAKQARYAHEALVPLLGARAREQAARFEAVQDVLGDHQDAVVADAWLLDAAHDAEDRDVAFVAGELAGLCLVDREAAREVAEGLETGPPDEGVTGLTA